MEEVKVTWAATTMKKKTCSRTIWKSTASHVSLTYTNTTLNPLQPYLPSKPHGREKFTNFQSLAERLAYLSRSSGRRAPGPGPPRWGLPRGNLTNVSHPGGTRCSLTPRPPRPSHPHVSATLPHSPAPHRAGRGRKGRRGRPLGHSRPRGPVHPRPLPSPVPSSSSL